MGNTIRREPVTFDIPKSPDYRHLNITNFRGLDVSSNPFELDNNTASDCLNVYVDESNTLTTRPRLQKKYVDLLKTLGDTWQPIGYYKLHDGYLLHGKLNNQPVMKLYINDEPLNDITGTTIPTNKCKIFEQGENIYLLDKENYTVINRTEKIVKDVEGYIPTTATVDINGNRFDVEPLNLLSDKYKESYYWDGLTRPNVKTGGVDTTLNYVRIDFNALFGQNKITRIHKVFPNENKLLVGVSDKNNFEDVLVFTNDKTYLLDYTNAVVTILYEFDISQTTAQEQYIVGCGENSNYIWFATKTKLDVFEKNDILNTYVKSTITIQNLPEDNVLSKLVCSPNGMTCYLEHYLFNVLGSQFKYQCYTYSHNNIYYNGDIDLSGNMADFYKINNRLYIYRDAVLYELNDNQLLYIGSITKDEYDQVDSIKTSNISDIIWVWRGSEYELYSVDNLTNPLGSYAADIVDDRLMDNAAYINQHGNGYLGVKIIPDITNYEEAYISPIKVVDDVIIDFEYYPNNYYHYCKAKREAVFYVCVNDYINITFTTLDSNWQDKRQLLFKSYLNTRFDNNYWFANGNRYYRSRNNDPTYFPITEYNDLGDSNLPITGFNLANDTTLIAYKDDRLYLIQPFESSSGTREYSITESKNTVGNTATDAPIVTTLTEIPLQINNDGVYGLSQLSNVSATERIADLMSRPINQRWLDIPDDIIKNAQTLNRLYWTYIILPDEAKSKTSIYLLDNRTNSWYYWELPIVVLDSFVVDNRAEFVDKNGEIYYLTTTDIDVPNFEDVLITEYYDDGEKLIDWYWQSQIMYLGTINYTKRLVNTTFILTDDDTTDGYGLKYGFKVFRKLASSVPDKEISNDINLVRSTTRKTNISKFGFLQMKISNITPDDRGTEERKEFRNNKLRLVGLGLKYVLLEGLIR